MAALIPRAPLRTVSATPAAQPLAEPAAVPGLCANELIISIWRDDWVAYEGTRAQLEDERLIPADFEWPRADAWVSWEVGSLRFSLFRFRPDGHKGPMRSWWAMDSWRINVQVAEPGIDRGRQRIKEKTKALCAEIHRQSPAGQREWRAAYDRHLVAFNDQAFQAFKSILLPPRKKPGRKPKARAVEGPQQAV